MRSGRIAPAPLPQHPACGPHGAVTGDLNPIRTALMVGTHKITGANQRQPVVIHPQFEPKRLPLVAQFRRSASTYGNPHDCPL